MNALSLANTQCFCGLQQYPKSPTLLMQACMAELQVIISCIFLFSVAKRMMYGVRGRGGWELGLLSHATLNMHTDLST